MAKKVNKYSRMTPELLIYSSGANPNATTMQQMQTYMVQNGDTVGDLTDCMLWQPNTEYTQGKLIKSPNLPAGYCLIAENSGFSGENEPEWNEEYASYSDGTISWRMYREVMPEDIPEVATEEEAMQGLVEDKIMTPKLVKLVMADGADRYGIAPNPVTHRSINKNGNTVRLKWADPADTVIDGAVLCEWAQTTIVKKEGSYPENENDGKVVAINTSRDMFKNSELVDTQENSNNWYYRAFPRSKGGLINYSELNRFGFWHYAVYIDEDDAVESTCVHKVPGYDNYYYNPLRMRFGANADAGVLEWGDWEDAPFMPRPCMLKSNGQVDYYLNPNDLTLREDGSASEIANTNYNGNAMMEWSAVFVKSERVDHKLYFYFCSEKYNEDYECYSLKHAGGYGEHFYLPIFEGTVINSKLRSINTNGRPSASTTAPNELLYARGNGTGWYPTTWADEDLMRCLGILVCNRLNTEAAIGAACGSSTSSLTHNVGTSVKKGMFFGHSGTSAYATKFFGMENWWGHRWRRPVGLMLKQGSLEMAVKLTRDTSDGSSVTDYNNTGDGYIPTGVFVPSMSQSYISKISGNSKCRTAPIEATGASATTRFCDGGWSSNGVIQLLCGGSVHAGSICGLFAFHVNAAPSRSDWYIGASLSYRNF